MGKLEDDAGEAQKFFDDIGNGDVPTILEGLDDEIIGTFTDVAGIFGILPTKVLSAAEAGITDAANLFNGIESGAITSYPDVIASGVTSAWGDFTSDLVDTCEAVGDAVACFFNDCPVAGDASISCLGNTQEATSTTRTYRSQPNTASAIVTLVSATPTSPYFVPGQTNTQNHVPVPENTDPPSNLGSLHRPEQSTLAQTRTQQSYRGSSSTDYTSTSNTGSVSQSPQVIYASGAFQLLSHANLLHLCWLAAFGLVGVALVLF